ncbi:DUF4397 domain-containing protein, partial [Paenibacillus sp. IB182496]
RGGPWPAPGALPGRRGGWPGHAIGGAPGAYGSHTIRMEPSGSRVRVVHASPDLSAVDICAGELELGMELVYRTHGAYRSVAPGQQVITVYAAGDRSRPLLSQTLNVQPAQSYTVAAGNHAAELRLYAYIDDPAPSAGLARVKFIHLASGLPEADIRTGGGTELFRRVPYGMSTAYTVLPAGAADVRLFDGRSGAGLLPPGESELAPDSVTTFLVVQGGDDAPAEALLLSDL